MTAVFDTLEFSERLKAGGFTDQQAKAATEAFAKATGQQLVTRADLREEVLRLERRIDALDIHLSRRIDVLESRLQSLENELQTLKSQFQALGSRFGALESRFQIMENRLQVLEQRLQGMEQRLLTRLGGLMVAGLSVIATLVAIF